MNLLGQTILLKMRQHVIMQLANVNRARKYYTTSMKKEIKVLLNAYQHRWLMTDWNGALPNDSNGPFIYAKVNYRLL